MWRSKGAANRQLWCDAAKSIRLAHNTSRYVQPDPTLFVAPQKKKYGAVIIGGGHNGLVSAAYLAKAGVDVLVLERRHRIGGAAVTEEMVPGFKFSRASYLAGLLRPHIIKDLELEKYGFKYLPRNPSSFTPSKLDSYYKGKYLLLGEDEQANWQSIAQHSVRDADNYPKYEEFLGKIRDIMQPILDVPPMDLSFDGNLPENLRAIRKMSEVAKQAFRHTDVLPGFYELFTGPAEPILNRWFESDILKTTLATDAVIGALIGPKQNGSAYVLLHHVMGEAAGKKGVWAYVQGGMGAVSEAIAASARHHGAHIHTSAVVHEILTKNSKAVGVKLADGTLIESDVILSNATPYQTFLELLPSVDPNNSGLQKTVSQLTAYQHHIKHSDYTCGSFKINLAVSALPNFTCFPSPRDPQDPSRTIAGPMHQGTVHFENHMTEIEEAYRDASLGRPASRPVIEMTIPSAVDRTLAPPGQHVVQLFVQYAPYHPTNWQDPAYKQQFVERVLSIVEEYCPGFKSTILGMDALSPWDLEHVFALEGGSISHGALGLHQLAYGRPVPGFTKHRTPIAGLYLCGAGTHPGGGVMGAAGHNAAHNVLSDLLGYKALFR